MEYSKLADAYARLEKTAARLEKTAIVATVLQEASDHDLQEVTLLLQGRLFPDWDERETGIAQSLMLRLIASSTGYTEGKVEQLYKELGDFGLVVEKLAGGKRQQTLLTRKLTVSKVFHNLQELAAIDGAGSQERKSRLVSELLSSAEPLEAKYIVRTVLGDLRIGVEKGVVRDAIARAFFAEVVWDAKETAGLAKEAAGKFFLTEKGLLERLAEKGKLDQSALQSFREKNDVKEMDVGTITAEHLWKKKSKADYALISDHETGGALKKAVVEGVEWAWFLSSDYGKVAAVAKEKGITGLLDIEIALGRPVNVLLAEKAPSLKDALEAFARPALEVKYDGARVQIHKNGGKIALFTRRLEDITDQFPDLVKMAKERLKPDSCIVEGEILGIDKSSGKPLPFQALSQRIRRKYEITKLAEAIPIQVNLFDIIYLDGRPLFSKSLGERRRLLEKSVRVEQDKFQLTEQLLTKDESKAEQFYRKALDAGQEGVMVKNLDAAYQPGRRVAGGWLKVKPTLETLDLVIVGAVWGTGKRVGWLGSLILGCKTEQGFAECGMMGTGIKEKKTVEGDVTLEEMTEMLKPHIYFEEAGTVKIRPKVVIEVAYEEIQQSPTYGSGYALRFPRFVRVRWDKGPDEADDIERLKRIYEQQKGRG
ncbi:MAG: ATP-dependent DNA ligase [Candidatus Aenigmarchaeota archaeon]|nr:ATP-dependent DNA ligase [Candidatus Aenigmarchaeota archaeon]